MSWEKWVEYLSFPLFFPSSVSYGIIPFNRTQCIFFFNLRRENLTFWRCAVLWVLTNAESHDCHHNRDTEELRHPPNSLMLPMGSHPLPLHISPGNPRSVCCSLVLPFPECPINVVTHILFLFLFASVSKISRRALLFLKKERTNRSSHSCQV